MADPCIDIEKRIEELRITRQAIQEELKNVPPSVKPGLIKLIKELNEEISAEEKKLAACREENPKPIFPKIAIELVQCLPSQEIRDAVETTITGIIPEIPSTAHAQCIDGSERIGIWVGPSGNEEARRSALDQVNQVRDGEQFGILAKKSLIKPALKALWDRLPTNFNDQGEIDEGGRNRVQAAYVRFESPNRILTVFEGTRKMPLLVPDIDFTMTITDTVSIEQGAVKCKTDSSVEADTNIGETILIAILGGPIGLYIALVKLLADAVDGLIPLNPSSTGGFGCQLAEAIFQSSIPLGNGLALIPSYSRLKVSDTFIQAGGSVGIGSSDGGMVEFETDFSNFPI